MNLCWENLLIILPPFGFPFTLKTKAGVFNFPRFEERFIFEKFHFRDRLVWKDGAQNGTSLITKLVFLAKTNMIISCT